MAGNKGYTRGGRNRDLGLYSLSGVPSTGNPTNGDVLILRRSFAAGGGGADVVTVYAAGLLPFTFRALDIWGFLSVGPGGVITASTLAVAGTALGVIDSAATGYRPCTAAQTATAVATKTALNGLFLQRGDSTAVGEVFMMIQVVG
jgi:hypothetical protein